MVYISVVAFSTSHEDQGNTIEYYYRVVVIFVPYIRFFVSIHKSQTIIEKLSAQLKVNKCLFKRMSYVSIN